MFEAPSGKTYDTRPAGCRTTPVIHENHLPAADFRRLSTTYPQRPTGTGGDSEFEGPVDSFIENGDAPIVQGERIAFVGVGAGRPPDRELSRHDHSPAPPARDRRAERIGFQANRVAIRPSARDRRDTVGPDDVAVRPRALRIWMEGEHAVRGFDFEPREATGGIEFDQSGVTQSRQPSRRTRRVDHRPAPAPPVPSLGHGPGDHAAVRELATSGPTKEAAARRMHVEDAVLQQCFTNPRQPPCEGT